MIDGLHFQQLVCRKCGLKIIGGKGDYWHITPDGRMGTMRAIDGHLAYPVKTENE